VTHDFFPTEYDFYFLCAKKRLPFFATFFCLQIATCFDNNISTNQAGSNIYKTKGDKMNEIIPQEIIEKKIYLIRRQKVMLDADLAELYDVQTKVFLQAVKRNIDRFPKDFMFQLTKEEFSNLRSQFVTSSWGGRRYLPYAFTEQGVAMLSSVLNSKRAIHINITIMRIFIRLRNLLISNTSLARKLKALEKKYDSQFSIVFDAIRQLMTPPEPKKRMIGFGREND
jgi:hypothetical protein